MKFNETSEVMKVCQMEKERILFLKCDLLALCAILACWHKRGLGWPLKEAEI